MQNQIANILSRRGDLQEKESAKPIQLLIPDQNGSLQLNQIVTMLQTLYLD